VNTPRKVVLVLVDSLNRLLLGAYGSMEFEASNLDRVARRSVIPARGRTGEDILEHRRKRVASGEIASYAVPERVVFAESLARTSVGKIDKRKLRQQYGA